MDAARLALEAEGGEDAMNLLFGALRAATGLSQQEAADLVKVRVDTVKHWSSGRRVAPPGVLEQLRGLLARQDQGAAQLAPSFAGGAAVEEFFVQSDEEAIAKGWPAAGPYNVMVARAWAMAT